MRNRILVALAAIALANVVTPSTTATKRPGGGAELKRFGSFRVICAWRLCPFAIVSLENEPRLRSHAMAALQ